MSPDGRPVLAIGGPAHGKVLTFKDTAMKVADHPPLSHALPSDKLTTKKYTEWVYVYESFPLGQLDYLIAVVGQRPRDWEIAVLIGDSNLPPVAGLKSYSVGYSRVDVQPHQIPYSGVGKYWNGSAWVDKEHSTW